jgi:hypothetical protein
MSFVSMSTGIRHFLVDGAEVRPVSERVLHDLRERQGRLPRYAGRDLRLLDLTVELRDRIPVEVRDVTASTLPLDEQGRLKSQLLDQLRASLRQAKPKPAWQPSREQIERATALAFGRLKSKRQPIAMFREEDKKTAPSRPNSRNGASSPSRAFQRDGTRKRQGYRAAPPRANRQN